MNVFSHSGDAGDLASSLPIVRHLGGGEFILCPHVGPGWPREPMTKERADFLLPLIAAQSYITAASFSEKPERVTHDFSTFRVATRSTNGELLTHWHARHLNLNPRAINLAPWIHADPSPETKGKIVLARSPRYHNPVFHWRRILQKFHGRMVFVGLPFEHAAFVKIYGPVDYRPVKDALEMASLIAGSELFIGNQSFPCWLAMAMAKNMIQESFSSTPNSRIPRPNARFVLNHFQI